MEKEKRGYLLTGENSFVEAYKRGDWSNKIADWPEGQQQFEAEFVAATKDVSAPGPSHITAKNMVFSPVCVSAVPPAQRRWRLHQPNP